MEFLQGQRLETTVAVAVAVVAVAAGAAYLFLRSRKSRGCLDPENFKEFKLVEKRQLSHNVAKFKFALPTPTSALGLPIGQHISCRGQDAAGEEVIKPYTPTTLDSDLGSFELVIKMYPQGRMSHHFCEMKVGDYLSVKGPKGRFKYLPGQVRVFGMIAGGSGITPMFQVARAILENPEDNTKVHLIYANVTYEDILLKEELDSMAKTYPDRFKIYYVLNQPPETWDGGVGFVSKEMIQAHCPAPAADIPVTENTYGNLGSHQFCSVKSDNRGVPVFRYQRRSQEKWPPGSVLKPNRANLTEHCFVYRGLARPKKNFYTYDGKVVGVGRPRRVHVASPLSGIAMWPSSHEQSHGCSPGRSRLHQGDAVPVLSSLSTNAKISGDGTGFFAPLSRQSLTLSSDSSK